MGIMLIESQISVNFIKIDVYCGVKLVLGVRGWFVRERQIYKGVGVIGDMDFINLIYWKGM